MEFDSEFTVIHDPQPAGLIDARPRREPLIWRCHIDLSRPNRDVRGFSPLVSRYDSALFSSPTFPAAADSAASPSTPASIRCLRKINTFRRRS